MLSGSLVVPENDEDRGEYQKGTFSRLKEQIEVVTMMYAIRGKTKCVAAGYLREELPKRL